jgi:hypothetical protein
MRGSLPNDVIGALQHLQFRRVGSCKSDDSLWRLTDKSFFSIDRSRPSSTSSRVWAFTQSELCKRELIDAATCRR